MQTLLRVNFSPALLFFRSTKLLAGALALAILSGGFSSRTYAQGCVAAHGSGLSCLLDLDNQVEASKWDIAVSYRWFKSDKHYVGTTYQAQRTSAGDQVINHSNFTD